MKKIIWAALVMGLIAVIGCGGDGGGSGGSGSGSGGGGGGSGGAKSSTTSGQSCSAEHECFNDECACTAGPNEGLGCCDPEDDACPEDKCDTFCKHCE